MLGVYKYETQMLQTANNLFRSGFHATYQQHVEVAAAANNECADNALICRVCDTFITDLNPRRLRLFYCGHLFHEQCLPALVGTNNLCPICCRKKTTNKIIKKMQIDENEKNVHLQTKTYAQKLNRLKRRMRERDSFLERSIKTNWRRQLSLAPANKEMMPAP